VPATIIDGKTLGGKVREEVAASVAGLGHVGLATVLVGDDPASHIYIDLKQKAATKAGMEARDLKLPADMSEDELLATIADLNADDNVDGLLVQLPLPDHIDENRVIEAIAPGKDVDGIHPVNAGRLYLGRPTLVPGTPLGIMRMLDEYEIPLEGARAVVIGRSAIVGKPMAHLLLQRNATVTLCHSRTQDIERHTLASRLGRHGQGGRDGDRCRDEPGREQPQGPRRRRPGRNGARRLHDPGARRRRADDNRDGASEHRYGSAIAQARSHCNPEKLS
jgi:methylenetetrahydrofolate dehydrogenase (NADP+)/methenyltetrahydrofolate cyclohydrolase